MSYMKQVVRTQFAGGEPSGSRKAILCARVSSKEQAEGYSLPAQIKVLRAYASQVGVVIVKEFSFAESAKQQGRKNFEEVLDYLRTHRDVSVALFEKTDRLSRNMEDYVAVEHLVESLDIEIHLVKEGQILRKTTNSQDRLVQGIFALLARNYIQNLQEEIIKGQTIKAERGHYPGMAPYGYMHDRATRTIVEDPRKGKVVRLMFRLYATGEYSVESLREALLKATGEKVSHSNLHRMLKLQFYIGHFSWRGVQYRGKYPHLIDYTTFARVQDIVSGRNGRGNNSRKHAFPYSGLLTCSQDGCMLTAEKAKGKYVYYHCSFGKGRHKVPYLPEAKLAEMLEAAVTQIQLPPHIAESILTSLKADQESIEIERCGVLESPSKRLSESTDFKLLAYQDRLRGLIDEGHWRSMSGEWRAEELRLSAALQDASSSDMSSTLDLIGETFELAQVDHNKWLKWSDNDRARIAKTVLSNCSTNGVSLAFDYRKPFDLIVDRAKNEEWRRMRDSNRR
jgi:site-specific DNA recombinase